VVIGLGTLGLAQPPARPGDCTLRLGSFWLHGELTLSY